MSKCGEDVVGLLAELDGGYLPLTGETARIFLLSRYHGPLEPLVDRIVLA